eukprot:gene25168-30395_t
MNEPNDLNLGPGERDHTEFPNFDHNLDLDVGEGNMSIEGSVAGQNSARYDEDLESFMQMSSTMDSIIHDGTLGTNLDTASFAEDIFSLDDGSFVSSQQVADNNETLASKRPTDNSIVSPPMLSPQGSVVSLLSPGASFSDFRRQGVSDFPVPSISPDLPPHAAQEEEEAIQPDPLFYNVLRDSLTREGSGESRLTLEDAEGENVPSGGSTSNSTNNTADASAIPGDDKSSTAGKTSTRDSVVVAETGTSSASSDINNTSTNDTSTNNDQKNSEITKGDAVEKKQDVKVAPPVSASISPVNQPKNGKESRMQWGGANSEAYEEDREKREKEEKEDKEEKERQKKVLEEQPPVAEEKAAESVDEMSFIQNLASQFSVSTEQPAQQQGSDTSSGAGQASPVTPPVRRRSIVLLLETVQEAEEDTAGKARGDSEHIVEGVKDTSSSAGAKDNDSEIPTNPSTVPEETKKEAAVDKAEEKDEDKDEDKEDDKEEKPFAPPMAMFSPLRRGGPAPPRGLARGAQSMRGLGEDTPPPMLSFVKMNSNSASDSNKKKEQEGTEQSAQPTPPDASTSTATATNTSDGEKTASPSTTAPSGLGARKPTVLMDKEELEAIKNLAM